MWLLADILLAYACIYIASSLTTPLPWSEEDADAAAAAAARNQSASEYFWSTRVLNIYDSFDGVGLGAVQPNIVCALLGVWVVVFVSIVFGKQESCDLH